MASSNQVAQSSGGVGVAGLLGVAFVVMKLCGVISWSWWWVTCPFWAWIPITLLVVAGVVLFSWLTTWFE